MRIAGAESGRRGWRASLMPASAGVRPPFFRLHVTQLEAEGHCPYLAVVNRDHLYFPLAPERDRLLPVDNLERLVRRVEKERLLHSLSSHDAGRLPGCQESARPNA